MLVAIVFAAALGLGTADDSEAPHAFFAGERLSIADRIAGQCLAEGQDVERRDDREVVCGRPMGGLKGAWQKFGVGRTNYDDKGRERLRFALLAREGVIRVEASRDIGPNRKTRRWSVADVMAVLAMLQRAGGARDASSVLPTAAPAARTSGPIIIPSG